MATRGFSSVQSSIIYRSGGGGFPFGMEKEIYVLEEGR